MFTPLRGLRCWGLAAIAACGACQAPPIRPLPAVDPAGLIVKYNERADRIPRLWAHVVVELRYTDEERKTHNEQGDGQLYVRKPHDLALSIGKVEELFWLGRNADRFWWFDEKPARGQPSAAYVGRIDDVGKAGMPRLPTPVPPDRLIELLGITRLPDGVTPIASAAGAKGDDRAAVWFDLPTSSTHRGVRQRLLIGAITARPQAIQFLDAGGRTLAEARLSEYRPMKLPGVPPGGWPDVATRIEVVVPAEKSRLVLYMESVSGDPSKFKDATFDFESIRASRNPQVVRELVPKP